MKLQSLIRAIFLILLEVDSKLLILRALDPARCGVGASSFVLVSISLFYQAGGFHSAKENTVFRSIESSV